MTTNSTYQPTNCTCPPGGCLDSCDETTGCSRGECKPHRHVFALHRHPDWHGHSDPSKPGYKPAGKWHVHFWWRHTHK